MALAADITQNQYRETEKPITKYCSVCKLTPLLQRYTLLERWFYLNSCMYTWPVVIVVDVMLCDEITAICGYVRSLLFNLCGYGPGEAICFVTVTF